VRTLLRRLAQVVVVLLVVTFFTAMLTDLLPGDPATTIAPFATEEQRDEIRESLGLDKPLVPRYLDWAGNFFTGDMGEYYAGAGVKGDDVFERAKDSVPRSLLLVLYVQVFTLLLAIPLGVLTAYRAGSTFDRGANGVVFALVALPTFVFAAILKFWLGVRLDLLPTIGYVSPGDGLAEHLKSMAMPVIVITVGQVAIYSRLLRSDMVATLQEDFILMAKAKGIPNRRILWRHALRPSSLTLLTVAGLNIGALIGGALIVERIFATGGLGSQIFDAINRRQYVPLQSFIAIVAVLYVVVNFFVDILYRVLDPRIRNV
jgi:peptide/nickel transport system permease protein